MRSSASRVELGDDLTLLIGNGCCDSTAPFLFSRYAPGPAGDPRRRGGGRAGASSMPPSSTLFDGREVVIDAREDPGGDSFSCETELGLRFTMERLPVPSLAPSGGGVSAAAAITSTNASRRTARPSGSSGSGSPNTIGPEAIVQMFAAALVTAITGTALPTWRLRAETAEADQRGERITSASGCDQDAPRSPRRGGR